MKKALFVITLLFSVFFCSCSIYENIYFLENGSVKYDMSIDASQIQILSVSPELSMNMPDSLPADTVIYLSQLIKDSLQQVDEYSQDLKNIAPFSIRTKSDMAKKELGMSLSGTFDSPEALNDAFLSLKRLEDEMKTKEKNQQLNNNIPVGDLYGQSKLMWDGTVMKRIVVPETDAEPLPDTVPENIDANNIFQGKDPFSMFFEKGKMIVKYHFPKKVKSVSNPDATLSQDGKTVVVEYNGSVFTKPTTEFSIEITTD